MRRTPPLGCPNKRNIVTVIQTVTLIKHIKTVIVIVIVIIKDIGIVKDIQTIRHYSTEEILIYIAVSDKDLLTENQYKTSTINDNDTQRSRQTISNSSLTQELHYLLSIN